VPVNLWGVTTLISIEPATGRLLRRREPWSEAMLRSALGQAVEAQAEWALRPPAERARPLLALAGLLRRDAPACARLMAEEMGKPLAQGRAEVEKCAQGCEHFARHAAEGLASEVLVADGAHCTLHYEPLGLILAIMPWNFPFWQVLRCAAPTLMAGNGLLVKHAPGVQGCAVALAELFREAGLPPGLYTDLPLEEAQVGALIARPEVAAVTLTGSTRAGRAVAEQAGRALKKCVLELGGSDPYVVLADADLEPTVATCVAARMVNTGQSCIAAKRFIVVQPLVEAFTQGMVAALRRLRGGAPLVDEDVDYGPLARRDLAESLHSQVQASVAAGARLLLGGELPAGPGAFYPPTVLADVRPGMRAFDEETFGPLAAIVPARDEAEALALANATPFGLGAALFTADLARGARLAREALHAGCCALNERVVSDARVPFGGIKASGFGRELGVLGLREFVNAKVVRGPPA